MCILYRWLTPTIAYKTYSVRHKNHQTYIVSVYKTVAADIASGQTGMNKIVSLRGQAVLDCLVSSLISTQWTRTTDGISNAFLLIASGCSVSGNNSEYYSTEQLGGNVCRLTIRNATMQQSGVYTCFDGSSTSYRSLVTVIGELQTIFCLGI